MSKRLMDALGQLKGVETTYVLINPEDYRIYPAPQWIRATDAWESQYIARQKVRAVLKQRHHMLFVNSWEFVVAFRSLARRVPAAVILDAVPATIDDQLRLRGHTGWKRWLSHQIHNRSFASAAKDFDYFLPMGSDCEDALCQRYEIGRERCFVTLAPQNLTEWLPGNRTYSPPLRLLFVGNDFARKGGDFLLRLYSQHLADHCLLTIVSNDPSVKNRSLPAKVQWLSGKKREDMLQIYRENDILLLPTQQDFMPQVLAEALAVGLPCIATDVGGIRDLIHHGMTGFLMHREATVEQWAEHIIHLVANPSDLVRLSIDARRFAVDMLDVGRFENLIADILERLRVRGERNVSFTD